MSDKLTGCDIATLLNWILAEEKTGTIFGIQEGLFFRPAPDNPFGLKRYGQYLETPLGVAAGPHSQLSQNIIASWLTGARYMELKTVQILDELEVTKPCIDMRDEGYNCEWSQELKLAESHLEYLNAWIVLHVLRHKMFGLNGADPGFIFNMSVGYNLEGILSPSVQLFLDRMENSASEKAELIDKLRGIYPDIESLQIPDRISNNITISTMHGCPPDEIEKIGRYFIEERKLNTTIKLNPTLLGPERLREILNHQMGYDVVVPDDAFEHDLAFDAGVELIKSLQKSADSAGVAFNIKLTNTLETENSTKGLPESEKMVYMSGRALHAISINVAARLQQEFEGKLDISFSAGVDYRNILRVLSCGLSPVTVCSDILKPGGYGRLHQYIRDIGAGFESAGCDSPDTFIRASAGTQDSVQDAALKNLVRYAESVVEDSYYHKRFFPYESIKTGRKLTVFDCTSAPCIPACPTGQAIPAYMRHTASGEDGEAFKVIMDTNPFPNVQGKVCNAPCRHKCTRLNLDRPLAIREIKRFVSDQNKGAAGPKGSAGDRGKVAIIGGGPSGLSCANFLAIEGFAVDIFEARPFAGGLAADAIPEFRLDPESLQRDIDAILSLGVRLHTGEKVDPEQFQKLRETYDAVYIAVGAQLPLPLGIPGEEADGVIDQLTFLSRIRQGETLDLGNRIAVIGAGNAAMDAARTANRLAGDKGEVTILYRRTRLEMPAEEEEIIAAEAEGIRVIELVSPEKIITKDGQAVAIECSKMTLGEPDDSGRRRPVKLEGETVNFDVDHVIPAIGQQVVLDFIPGGALKIDPGSGQTQLEKVFAGGDAVRGASTLIEAIGDGRRIAQNIIKYNRGSVREDDYREIQASGFADYHLKLAQRDFGFSDEILTRDGAAGFELATNTLPEDLARAEAERCLSCDLFCSICTTVCPNRANLTYRTEKMSLPLQVIELKSDKINVRKEGQLEIEEALQILNIGDYCNECGNCTTFCPTDGAPYITKPRFCISREAFEKEENAYYLKGDILIARKDGVRSVLKHEDGKLAYSTVAAKITLDPDSLAVDEVRLNSGKVQQIDLSHAAEMAVLLKSLRGFYLFQ